VDDTHRQSKPSTVSNGAVGKARLSVWVLLFFSLALISGKAAAGTSVQTEPLTAIGLNRPFVFADFDGDLRPDLASIQVGQSDLTHADYWIRLHLSTTGWESFQVLAPVGGIRLVARDVNGDDAPDLVLSTSLKEPVAILLNEGDGKFVQVDPASFPEALGSSETNWEPATRLISDVAGTPPQSSSEIRLVALCLPRPTAQSNDAGHANSRSLLDRFLIVHAGRAPPLEVPYL
jgi:hypothetical protein